MPDVSCENCVLNIQQFNMSMAKSNIYNSDTVSSGTALYSEDSKL